MTEAKELLRLSDADLAKKAGELRRELTELRIAYATRKLKNHNQLASKRRELARILTVLREREILREEGQLTAPKEEKQS